MREPGCIFLLLAFSTGAAFAQQQGPGFEIDFDQVQIRTEHVAGHVYVLTGDGGNIGVFAGADGVFMVDDQFAPLTGKIRAAVAEVSSEPIRFIINTHFHEDHTSGNESFAATGALVIAHENVRRTLSSAHFMETVNTLFPAFAPGGLPVITFKNGVTLHLNDEDVRVFHTSPAHTDGDAIVYFTGSDVIHIGDIYRRNGPVWDHNNGGSYEGLIENLGVVVSMMGERTKVIPGHGRISMRADLIQARNDLVTVRDRIAAGISAGKTLAEISAEHPTRGLDWSMPRLLSMERVIEWIYLELSAKSR